MLLLNVLSRWANLEGKFLNVFKEEHPDYQEFMYKFDQVTTDFHLLNEKIVLNNQILKNIESYKQRVQEYFSDDR